jgi:hypothetical protein
VSAGLSRHLCEREFPVVGVCSSVRTLLQTLMSVQTLPLGRPDGNKRTVFAEL